MQSVQEKFQEVEKSRSQLNKKVQGLITKYVHSTI